MLKPVFENPWVRAVGLLLALALFAFLCYLLSPVLTALFFAFLVAYVLDPVVNFFEARRIPRGVAIAGLAVVGILVIASVPTFLIPGLLSDAEDMTQTTKSGPNLDKEDEGEQGQLSDAEDTTRAVESGPKQDKQAEGEQGPLARVLDAIPLERLAGFMGWTPDLDIGARAFIAQKAAAGVSDLVREHASELASAGQSAGFGIARFVGAVGRGTAGFLAFLGNLALFAFVAGYLLKDFDGIIAAARDLVPPKFRPKTVELVGKIDAQVRGFLRGQLVVCACLGVMYAIGLTLSGTPFAILIAAFGAIASFVPYLGIVLTIGPALLLTWLEPGSGLGSLVGVVLTFTIAQLIEGTILTPKIVGDKVGLSPVWVILAILVFGNALGFLGLLLAVPIAASLKVLVVELVAYYKTSGVFEGGGSPGGTDSG